MARAEGPCALATVAVLAILAWTAAAHEYHASLAEVELNPESGRLEVALRVIPEDLEAALASEQGRTVRLETTVDVDALIVTYLESRFRVVGPSRKPQSITWVGKEVSHQAAWLYFEIPYFEIPVDSADPVDPADSWTLENRILFDLEPGQINTVLFRSGQTRSTWSFTVDSEPVELP